MKKVLTRRELFRVAGVGSAMALLASCQPKVVEKIVKETVIVQGAEKIVKETVIVQGAEKVVKETVIVEKAGPGKVTLVFSPRTGPPPEVFKPYFEEKYPNLELRWEVGAGDIRPRLTAHMMAGDAPDVFGTCCSDSSFFMQQGQTLNLQPHIDRDDWDMTDFHPMQFTAWLTNGDIHALPTYTGTYALYYNKDMFDEKGVAYPSQEPGNLDFDDFRQMLLKFVDRTEPVTSGVTGYCLGGGGSAWVTQIWLRGFGAHMVDPNDNSASGLCAPEAVECLNAIQKMTHEDYSIGCGGEAQRWIGPGLFAGGRAAMLEMGSWGLNQVRDGATFNWDVGAMWGGKGGTTSHVSVDCDEVYAHTKYPDEAWTLINELTSVEAEIMQIEAAGSQPSRISVLEEWVQRRKAAFPAFEPINLNAFTDVVSHGFGEPEEMFSKDEGAKRTILGPVMDEILLLNSRPASDICEYAQLATRYCKGEVAVEDIGAEMDKLK